MRPMHLFCFGLGYSALALARLAAAEGWAYREPAAAPRRRQDAPAGLFRRIVRSRPPIAGECAARVTHVLVSVPPDDAGDPVLDRHADDIAALPGLSWLGYLSTTGVYGDRGGGGSTRPQCWRRPASAGAAAFWPRRVGSICGAAADASPYLPAGGNLWSRPQPVCRVAGRRRQTHRQAGPGLLRIHVEDLALVLRASMARPRPGAVTMSATTTRRRPRRSSHMRQSCSASRRRLWWHSTKPGCRRWRGVSMKTTNGSATR